MVNPGDEIEYSFTVINTGNVTVTNITVSDPMMPVEGGPIDLEVGESDETTFTGVYVITQEDIDAGGVWNLALAEGEDPNGDPVEDDSEDPEPLDPSDPNYDPDCPDCTFTELDQDPSIELLKSGVYVDATDDSITNPGDEIHYTFVVTNTGNVTLTDVVLDDDRLGVVGLPVSSSMEPGDIVTVTYEYVVTQEDIDDGGVWNIATATGEDPEGDPVEDDSEDPEPLDPSDPNYDPDCPDCTVTELEQDPSIELEKIASPGDYRDGDEIEYTFVVTNTGNVTLSNITLQDTLPGIVISGNDHPLTLSPGESDMTHFTARYVVTDADIVNRGGFNHATVTRQDPKGEEVEDDDEEDVIILIPPVAENDEVDGGIPGQPVRVPDITSNDEPGNCGPVLTETLILYSPDGVDSGQVIVVDGEGTWSVDTLTGDVIFAPEPRYLDQPTPISYTGRDECDQQTGAQITVRYIYIPPVADDDFKDKQIPGWPVTLPIWDNDAPGNDGPLDEGSIDLLSTIDEAGVPSQCLSVDSLGRCTELDVPGEGVWVSNGDGGVTFTPGPGFYDDPTPVVYTIEDEAGQVSNEATITILYDYVFPPNCSNTAPAILSDCNAVLMSSDLIVNWKENVYPLTVSVYDRWGVMISGFPIELENAQDSFRIDVSSYMGERLEFHVENETGRCSSGFIDVSFAAGINMESAWQDDDPRENVSRGKMVVYCGQVPGVDTHVPEVSDPCGGWVDEPTPMPEWVTTFACGDSDTAEVILRNWEAIGSEGQRVVITDTIIVMRLPKLTAASFVGEFKNHYYCELDGYSDRDEPMVEYASWKQPVGIGDYELPVEKLGHVVYHIPGSIIHAGLANACAQGDEIKDAYLNQVIVKYTDGNVVRIRDIIDGSYMSDMMVSTTTTQKGYGILQAIYDGTMSPYNISLPCGSYTFFEYLLLPMGAEVMSESGSYERVGMDWFYNGSGNAPYWFSGGWPSLYGSGKCVSYCDAGGDHEFDCIGVMVPVLTSEGYDLNRCDTICLTGYDMEYCGLRVTQELSAWTGDCEQERVLETRVEQSCWADIENICGDEFVEIGDECLVAEYEDNEECCGRINITLRQMQVMHDTLPPVFDFCYSTDWDQDAIKSAISNGEQPAEALAWERRNPTIYMTDLRDCSAEVFVPSVTVTDNCSGIQQMKAVFYNYDGGVKAVELELTSVDTVLMPDGRECVNHTYSHTGEGIRVPFQGCGDDEFIEVVYEASD